MWGRKKEILKLKLEDIIDTIEKQKQSVNNKVVLSATKIVIRTSDFPHTYFKKNAKEFLQVLNYFKNDYSKKIHLIQFKHNTVILNVLQVLTHIVDDFNKTDLDDEKKIQLLKIYNQIVHDKRFANEKYSAEKWAWLSGSFTAALLILSLAALILTIILALYSLLPSIWVYATLVCVTLLIFSIPSLINFYKNLSQAPVNDLLQARSTKERVEKKSRWLSQSTFANCLAAFLGGIGSLFSLSMTTSFFLLLNITIIPVATMALLANFIPLAICLILGFIIAITALIAYEKIEKTKKRCKDKITQEHELKVSLDYCDFLSASKGTMKKTSYLQNAYASSTELKDLNAKSDAYKKFTSREKVGLILHSFILALILTTPVVAFVLTITSTITLFFLSGPIGWSALAIIFGPCLFSFLVAFPFALAVCAKAKYGEIQATIRDLKQKKQEIESFDDDLTKKSEISQKSSNCFTEFIKIIAQTISTPVGLSILVGVVALSTTSIIAYACIIFMPGYPICIPLLIAAVPALILSGIFVLVMYGSCCLLENSKNKRENLMIDYDTKSYDERKRYLKKNPSNNIKKSVISQKEQSITAEKQAQIKLDAKKEVKDERYQKLLDQEITQIAKELNTVLSP